MTGTSTRYIASFIVEIFAEFMAVAVEKLQLSPEEVAILCVVVSKSTRDLRKDPFVARNFGSEDFAVPDEERPAVSLRMIYTSLGLSRETTRRKVARMVEMGYLKRTAGGVIFPSQTGPNDYTAELRSFLVRKLAVMDAYRSKLPD